MKYKNISHKGRREETVEKLSGAMAWFSAVSPGEEGRRKGDF